MKNEVEIVPINESHFEKLAFFLEKETSVFLKSFWLDRFEMFWKFNEDNPRGWIILGYNEIFGVFLNITANYMIDDQEVPVNIASTWYVVEKYRYLSLKLFYQYRKLNGVLLDTTPTHTVAHILEKFGFNNVNRHFLNSQAVYITNRKNFAKFFFLKISEKYPFLGFTFIFSPFVSLIIKLRQKKFNNSIYTVSQIYEFDNRFDELWNRMKNRYSFTLKRDSKSLNWLFFGCTGLKQSRLVWSIENDKELIGYIAFKIEKKHVKGNCFHFIDLEDVFLYEENADIYQDVCNIIISYMKSHDEVLGMFLYPITQCFSQFINTLNPLRRRKSNLYYLYGIEKGLLKNSYITPVDGDISFFP